MGRSPSVSSEESGGGKRRKVDSGKVNEELSVDATNALREKLGLKPLYVKGEGVKKEKKVEEKKEEFAEELSVEATNSLREKLGLKPLYTPSEEKTSRNEIFNPTDVAASVQKATSDLKLDSRVGINKVRAQSSWDDAFLAKTKSGTEFTPLPFLDTGSSEIINPDFKAGLWNCHLNISATNELRKDVGLRPLHPPK